ncbi:uncharacterized protein LOC126911833 isoform X2 [Spodoptera frugiperda]|nr:uncharacterized protein LOC126911833 isoform X2 [Spodoptera frugiperda]
MNAYCSLPCPFMYSAPPPASYGYLGTQPRTPVIMGRSYISYEDYTDSTTEDMEPPAVKPRQSEPDTPSKSKPVPEEPSPPPPPPKKKAGPNSESPPAPIGPPGSIGPSGVPTRRFFTSLFSIPGAVMDTLLSGEIVL